MDQVIHLLLAYLCSALIQVVLHEPFTVSITAIFIHSPPFSEAQKYLDEHRTTIIAMLADAVLCDFRQLFRTGPIFNISSNLSQKNHSMPRP